MDPKQRQKLLLVGAALCLVVFVGDRLVLSPLMAGYDKRKVRIAELRLSLEKGYLLLGREDGLRVRWEDMTDRCLPGEASAAETVVWKALDRWVGESGIALTSQKPRWLDGDGLAHDP